MVDNHLLPRQRARPRPAQHHLAARARRQRPRAAQHRHRPGRPAGRRPAPDRLRHHRRLRGDGDPRARHRRCRTCATGSAASSSATRRDGEPVTAEDLAGGRRDGGDPARRDQAQPAADAREHAGARPRRAVRQHRARQLVDRRRPDRHPHAATTSSPRPASAPTWAPSGSSTSSAGPPGSRPTPPCSSPRSARSRRTPASTTIVAGRPLPDGAARREPRRGPRRRRPTCASRSRTSGCTACRRSSRSTPSPTDHAVRARRRSREIAAELGARSPCRTHFADGGAGATELAEAVAEAAERADRRSGCSTPTTTPLREKIETVATQGLRRRRRRLHAAAARQLDTLRAQRVRQPAGVHRQDPPVDLVRPDAARARRPAGRLPVREVRASVGAGFVYPICGEMRTMPGLGSVAGGCSASTSTPTATSSA